MHVRWLLLMTLVGTGCLLGCMGEEAEESRLHEVALAAGQEPAADLFHTDVTMFRRYTGSNWMLDEDLEFRVKDESRIKAEVVFRNVRPERTYSVHLVWVKPDGDEAFLRYAEVTRHLESWPAGVVADSTGALPDAQVAALAARWGQERAEEIAARLAADPSSPVPVTERSYLDAEDLGYDKTRIFLEDAPDFELSSILNISREKERPLGSWTLRVYLDRRLLREIPFTLVDLS